MLRLVARQAAGTAGASPADADGATAVGYSDAGLDAAAPDAGAPAAAPDAGAPATVPDAGAPAAPPVPAPAPAPSAPGPAPALSWTQVKTHKNDALWWFNGEHPSGFSTTTHLQAAGFANPALLTWAIAAGADKVAFAGAATGDDVRLASRRGSTAKDDVTIRVQEGAGPAAPSFTGHVTVFAPSRLIHRADTDHAACPAWGGCGAGCPAYWTEIGYRIVDNMGGTIVGATVNENFPGVPVADQANDWVNPGAFATVPFWRNTNGTFVDNWFVACGNPPPAPGTPGAGTGVDRMPHEFYVGSDVPAHGVRVQAHTAHRYIGFARHEAIRTPAP
jgi:hypothetical protein